MLLKKFLLIAILTIGASGPPLNAIAAEANAGVKIEPFLNIYYDDNITYERDASRKKTDVILEPGISASYKTKYPVFYTRFFGGITGELYKNYSAYSYGIYKIGIAQGLPNRMSTTMRYSLMPNVCLEEDAAGTACAESTDYHTFSLSLDKDFTDALFGGVYGKYGIKNYETRYNYKDTGVIGGGADATYRIAKIVKIGIGYSYESGVADGENN